MPKRLEAEPTETDMAGAEAPAVAVCLNSLRVALRGVFAEPSPAIVAAVHDALVGLSHWASGYAEAPNRQGLRAMTNEVVSAADALIANLNKAEVVFRLDNANETPCRFDLLATIATLRDIAERARAVEALTPSERGADKGKPLFRGQPSTSPAPPKLLTAALACEIWRLSGQTMGVLPAARLAAALWSAMPEGGASEVDSWRNWVRQALQIPPPRAPGLNSMVSAWVGMVRAGLEAANRIEP